MPKNKKELKVNIRIDNDSQGISIDISGDKVDGIEFMTLSNVFTAQLAKHAQIPPFAFNAMLPIIAKMMSDAAEHAEKMMYWDAKKN